VFFQKRCVMEYEENIVDYVVSQMVRDVVRSLESRSRYSIQLLGRHKGTTWVEEDIVVALVRRGIGILFGRTRSMY
jgi:hypothetical protein